LQLFADVEFSFPNEQQEPGVGPTLFPGHRIVLSTMSEPVRAALHVVDCREHALS